MDWMMAMKAAVAAGVDGVNVDYPRLGADAVGRPVGADCRICRGRQARAIVWRVRRRFWNSRAIADSRSKADLRIGSLIR